jgi:hypothetical protein
LPSQALQWCGWRRERRVMLSRLLSGFRGCNSNDTQRDHDLARNQKFIPISTTNESLILGSNATIYRFMVSCCYLGIGTVHLCVLVIVEIPGSPS